MRVRIKCGENFVEAEGEKHTEIWEQLAGLSEVFGEQHCGKCKSHDIFHVVRQDSEDNKYYELHCANYQCRARKRMGAAKKGGGLFPKKKDQDGEWLPDNGWMRWNKETGKEE